MRYRIHHIDRANRQRLEDHVRLKAQPIEQRLPAFEDDLVLLDIRLGHRTKRYANRRDASLYDAHIVLDIDGHHLPNIGATGHAQNWRTAVNEAFDDLEDQLDDTLATLQGEARIHDYQHRPSWVRSGADMLGKPQEALEQEEPEDQWMEEYEERGTSQS